MPSESLSPAKAIAKWNEQYPMGTPVRYWRGLREGIGRLTTTRGAACMVGGKAMIWLHGAPGMFELHLVEPLPPEPKPPASSATKQGTGWRAHQAPKPEPRQDALFPKAKEPF